MPITILELAEWRGATNDGNSFTMEAVESVGLPFLAGCQSCGASLACYNAYPSKTGYIRCKDCIADLGYDTVAEANREIFDE